jgi:hypothetical protein
MAPRLPALVDRVHYVSFGSPGGEYPSTCRAAIVTEVDQDSADPDVVGLCVLNPTGQFFKRGAEYDFGLPPDPRSEQAALCDGRYHVAGTWHWPPAGS